jgi:uncharacterized repeat protein (TIGR03803 family)
VDRSYRSPRRRDSESHAIAARGDGSNYKIVHSFGGDSDGDRPVASLIDVSGTLYGTTEFGGTFSRCDSGCGTVFALSP